MPTTLLFVELLISGSQTLIWVIILSLAVLGVPDVVATTFMKNNQAILLVLYMSISYTFGILFDRLTDSIFSPLDKKYKSQIIGNNSKSTMLIRLEIAKDNEYLHTRFEYYRSRIRIARNFTINILMLSISLLLFVTNRCNDWEKECKISISIYIVIVTFSLFSISLYSWTKLTKSQLKLTNDQIGNDNE